MTYQEFREKGYLFDIQVGDDDDIIIVEDAARQIVTFKSPFKRENYRSDDDYLKAVWDEIHDN